MKRKIKPYYVILWDDNNKTIEHHDVMQYFMQEYLKDKKSKSKNAIHPTTFDEIKEFILNKSMYMYWARCQYEVVIQDWPCQKYSYKLDAHEQIKMNIDTITNHFISQL